MVSLPMIVRHELVKHAQEAPLDEENQAVETLLANRAHEAFSVVVGVRRPDGRQDDAHSDSLEQPAECVRPLPSRSQIKTRWPARNPSTTSVSRRAAWAMNAASG